MTAKNKRSKSKSSSTNANELKNDTAVKETAKKNATSSPSLNDAKRPFTKAQLCAILFLMAGLSRLREFSTALSEEHGEKCMSYLHDEGTCGNGSFKSLIQVKYLSGISLTSLVFAFVWQLWISEYHFLKFISCLSFSPLFTTVLAVVALNSSEGGSLDSTKTLYICMIAMSLFVMAAPSSAENLPFLPDNRPVNVKAVSLQAVALWSLLGATAWEIARVVLSKHDGGLQNALLKTSNVLPEPAMALVYFWVVDKFSMILLYGFAIVHFPVFKQRAILLAACLIKLLEFYNFLPNMMEPWHDQELLKKLTMGLAAGSGLAWLGP